MALTQRSRRLLAFAGALLLVAVVLAASRSGPGGVPGPPLPGTGVRPAAGDPFGFSSGRQAEFVARATAGCGQPLFTHSPGGAAATAARVARLRRLIDAATRGSGIDPRLVEGLVFVESAGRPYAVAGSDPASAAGLTQILAATATSLLGLHVDLAADRRIMARLAAGAGPAQQARLLRALARADGRFDPRQAVAATVRYLTIAEHRFGREDLAVESYHMGIGNLQHVLSLYDGGAAVPYAQLYFDTFPDRHRQAFSVLSGFGDQSSLYLWRILGAVQIMRLFRSDPAALRRLSELSTTWDSTALVLHPPDRSASFEDPQAVSDAYSRRELVPLPADPNRLGLRYASGMGAAARRLGVPVALYRGLRPAALDLLGELSARVRALSGSRAPLVVASTVQDRRYQSQVGVNDPPATTGYTFTLARRYAGGRAQAVALQAMLDRLQALNLIGWSRLPDLIEVTVAGDASQTIARGV